MDYWLVPLICGALAVNAGEFHISGFYRVGSGDAPQCIAQLDQSFTNGIVTMEDAEWVAGGGVRWTPRKSFYSLGPETATLLPLTGAAGFFRARQVDLSGGMTGFTNFVHSYSIITTIAGRGGGTAADVNKWRPDFENGPATAAELSRPHTAMGDLMGNVYIADKDAHGIRKIRPDGTIVTVAGTGLAGPNASGNGPDYLTNGTAVALSHPNGLFVHPNGVVFIMDTDNGKIRRLDPNGLMQTLFTDPNGTIFGGRGLWVSADEQIVYYCSGDKVRRWTATNNAVSDFATLSADLGNLDMDPQGRLVVTVRGSHQVFRLSADGSSRELMAGNGSGTGGIVSGVPAIQCPLNQVRGVAVLPNGALLLATDKGSQIGYVDTDGIIHRLLNGDAVNAAGESHSGDGQWFYQNPDYYKVSEIRAVTLDALGNILITEHDAGYIRLIRFLPHDP